METAALLARHLQELVHGDNLAGSYLKQHLDDITMSEATCKIGNLNTIAALTFHINYYVEALINVLEGGPLEAKDSLSYTFPPIATKESWDSLRSQLYANIERFAVLITSLSQTKLKEVFVKEAYGSYERNIIGLSEHLHYHLGQIVVIKKLIRNGYFTSTTSL